VAVGADNHEENVAPNVTMSGSVRRRGRRASTPLRADQPTLICAPLALDYRECGYVTTTGRSMTTPLRTS